MSVILSQFLAYVLVYKYAGLFLIVFAGSFIVPLPLNEMILVVSALSSGGFMDPWYVFYVSLFSNMLADILGYSLTRIYGHAIFDKLKIKQDDKYFKAKKYLENYAYGTIFFSKIVGPFGPWVNFLSGLINIPFKKWLFFDFSGNFIDVAVFTLAGYFLGKNWQEFLKNTWILGLIALLAFIAYIAHKTHKKLKTKDIRPTDL